MPAQIITSGVAYSQFVKELRIVIWEEVNRLMPGTAHAAPSIGGLALAQEITRLSKPRLYALVSARQIPHTKRGNKLYFNRVDLLAWLEQGRRT